MIIIGRYLASSIKPQSYRPEQKRLRKWLINNKEHKCIICQRQTPLYLLECAHLKSRQYCTLKERNDTRVVQWMCRNCHKLYDSGNVAIHNEGNLEISSQFDVDKYKSFINLNYDNTLNINDYLKCKEYYDYHFNRVFKK